MTAQDFIIAAQWVFFVYFIGLHGGYLMLNVVAMFSLRNYMEAHTVSSLPRYYSQYEPPISVIVPAYNESVTIGESIRALLQLEYPEFEIVIVNDGSTDETLDTLIDEFSLASFPEAHRIRLKTSEARQFFRSTIYANLRLIDKVNGGKSDAINAGLNAARYPIFCVIDADSVLQRDSLQRAVQPFLEDPRTIAAGGTVRILNGCTVSGGFVESIELPRNPLSLFQIVEYLRAFLFGRLGWSSMNANLIVSGAFGLFHKETVINAGAFRTDTVGEDMELTVRLHRTMREKKQSYRITYVPDPICWTEAPEDLRTLGKQRVRWQRGLAESMTMNIGLPFCRRAGAAGWISFPYMFLFELLGPLLEVSGFLFIAIGFWQGWVTPATAWAFMLVAVGLGVLLSASSIALEEMSFHVYPRARDTARLFLMAILENFGYRQLNSVWRMIGMFGWLFRRTAHWGEMPRAAGHWGGQQGTDPADQADQTETDA